MAHDKENRKSTQQGQVALGIALGEEIIHIQYVRKILYYIGVRDLLKDDDVCLHLFQDLKDKPFTAYATIQDIVGHNFKRHFPPKMTPFSVKYLCNRSPIPRLRDWQIQGV